MLTRETTRQLVGGAEWVALGVQVIALVVSAATDGLDLGGRVLLGALASAHALAAVVALRTRGPFARGGPWLAAWLGAVVVAPVMMAHLVGPLEYGASPTCVQMCGYPAPVVVLLAFFPWWPPDRQELRLPVVTAAVVVVVGEPLWLVSVLHERLGVANYLSIVTTGATAVIALLFGVGVRRLCLNAIDLQGREKERSRRFWAERAHSELSGVIAALRIAVGPGPPDVHARIDDLADAVERIESDHDLLTVDQVTLAELVTRWVGVWGTELGLTTPRVGNLTLTNEVAHVVSCALADLLSNAARHGAAPGELSIHVEAGVLVVEVDDAGDGFPAGVLDRQGTSLWRLRESARTLGGDLIHGGTPAAGSRMCLRLPLHPP